VPSRLAASNGGQLIDPDAPARWFLDCRPPAANCGGGRVLRQRVPTGPECEVGATREVEPHAELLAGRVGQPFAQLVGDPHVCAERLVEAYNGLKHDPRYQPDAAELRLLAWSADVLLMCALLDRIAGSKAASRRVLSDYRIEQGGEAVRASLGAP